MLCRHSGSCVTANGMSMAGSITPGSWQFVVGTFNQPGNRTIYVGDANGATQTTATATGPDANASPYGLPVIEIGRYDNQDLDGRVDDIFVFGDELNAHTPLTPNVTGVTILFSGRILLHVRAGQKGQKCRLKYLI